jgi:hypothetical protein
LLPVARRHRLLLLRSRRRYRPSCFDNFTFHLTNIVLAHSDLLP